jgi:hypothetical protein
MPRFYFHLRAESRIHRDLHGSECRDVFAADWVARSIAAELMRNSDRKTRLWSICVEDEHGRALFDVFFADLAAELDGLSRERQELAAETCRRVQALIDAMCAVRDTVMQSRILLARARAMPQLVHSMGGGRGVATRVLIGI